MRYNRFSGRDPHKPTALTLFMSLLLMLGAIGWLSGVAHGQNNQCWTNVNGVWTYNPACSQTPNAPLKVAVGKYLTVNNILTLSGTDNASLNIGQGGTLGSAAFASATQFQPAGGGGNSSAYYGGSLTIGTGTDYISITTSTGLSFSSGMWVLCAYTSNPTQYMYGYVDTYNPQTGVLKVTVPATGGTGGSGAYTGWNISVAGAIGPTGSTGSAGGPTGSIVAFGGTSLPSGYLWCDGTQYACSSYPALCAALGSTWGGNGTTTFNVPDLRGRFPIGAGQGQTAEGGGTGTNRVLGTTSGAETHTTTVNEMPSHNHAISISDPGHQHYFYGGMANSGSANATWGPQSSNVESSLTTSLAYTGISASAGYTGGGAAHSIMDPFAVVNYIIHQ